MQLIIPVKWNLWERFLHFRERKRCGFGLWGWDSPRMGGDVALKQAQVVSHRLQQQLCLSKQGLTRTFHFCIHMGRYLALSTSLFSLSGSLVWFL